jgi:hypothetical protein
MSIDQYLDRQTLPLSDDTACFQPGPRDEAGQDLLEGFPYSARHDRRLGHCAVALPTQADGGGNGQ